MRRGRERRAAYVDFDGGYRGREGGDDEGEGEESGDGASAHVD